MMCVNWIMPGARRIQEAADVSPIPLDAAALMRHPQSQLSTKLSTELDVLLMQHTTGRAKGQMKALDSIKGLEGWRLIRRHLGQRDDH